MTVHNPIAAGPASPEPDWHALDLSEVADRLATDPELGLPSAEAARRLAKYGPNRLREDKAEPFWEEFLEELREPLILLLVFTGVLYLFLGEISDGITIFFVILTLNTIEVLNEQRAKKAVSALRKLAEPNALVIRDGRTQEVPVETVAPGDVIVLQAGRRVPADARLCEGYGLSVDESSMTGESVPVGKDPAAAPSGAGTPSGLHQGVWPRCAGSPSPSPAAAGDAPLAERLNMVYSGTLVTRGRGKAVATATGMATELGRIAGMTRGVKEPRTPLQKAMEEVSKSLVGLALGFSVLIPVLGVLIAGQPLQTMLLTGLSLAFATIPEEMPIIITMVLSLGAYRLSKQNAIVKRLKAVETLGAVTVIATDKTGTLTENRMEVSEVFPADNRRQILTAGVLCSDITDGAQTAGDPLEAALLRAARQDGIDEARPRLDEYPFDNERKRMAVITAEPGAPAGQVRVWVKGAPESVLAISSQAASGAGVTALDAQAWLAEANRMAAAGLRVIAFAEKLAPARPAGLAAAESGLTFLGLAGLLDPPRAEVKEAIANLRGAGIRSIMVTGDHPLTARAIAQAVGLDGDSRVVTGAELDGLGPEGLDAALREASIFARTTPEHKLRIVRALEAQGERVAVTGDGVNDAPALAAADIGVAMGASGSDVAREAGDVVLADDNYTTIAHAIREGRVLFANLKKAVRYYLAIKVALVAVMALPVLLRLPVPFAPVQIILMELFMDLAAAAAFVAEPPEGDLMRQPPRDPRARFMDRALLASILANAAGLFAAVSAAYLLTWYGGAGLVGAQTVAFSAWMLGHVLLAFHMRSERQPLAQLGLFSNRLMLLWGAATLAFIALATGIPWLNGLLKTRPLGLRDALLVLACAFLGTVWIEGRKWVEYKK